MVPPRITLQQRLIYHTHKKEGGKGGKANHLATPAAGKAPLVVYPEISLLLIKLPPLETGAKSISGVPSPGGFVLWLKKMRDVRGKITTYLCRVG